MTAPISTGAAAPAAPAAMTTDPKIREAAEGFEGIFMSMLVGEMMKGTETEAANPLYTGLMTEKLGDELARSGGIGLADVLERQLGGRLVSPVETCRECGRLFGYLPRGICAECQDLREERFQAVRAYLGDNRGASIVDTAAATGVDEGLIVAFIRDGRLQYGGSDAGQLDGFDHDEDVKARIRAQLAAQAGPAGTDPRGTDPQGPAAASQSLGMRSRGR